MSKDKRARPPSDLLRAFQATEAIEQVAVLMVDDESWDPEAMRVLAAWQHLEHRWETPARGCPDGGTPTARAWAWLVSGWSTDIAALAAAANVSESTARAKIDILRGSRLIYPDGSMQKFALAALRSHVAKRLTGGKRRAAPAKDDGSN